MASKKGLSRILHRGARANSSPPKEVDWQQEAEEYHAKFPHCDARVLHAPGECTFCDHYPDKQHYREMNGIAFTGHKPVMVHDMREGPKGHKYMQEPCPADAARPRGSSADHRLWPGNRAGS